MAHRRLQLLRPEGAGAAGSGAGADDVEVTVEPPERVVPAVPEPTPFTESDVVPAFRADLRIGKGDSPGLFEITDPRTERSFVLYEFELSMARMLDGRRRVSDVLASGVRLGIPVDIHGLYKFVRQLWHYGFLAPVTGLASGLDDGSGWPERERWDEATRMLFQTGLRLVRQGRPLDASSYFQAVLGADPDNAQAAELLAAIERGESLAAAPIGLHAPARPDAPSPAPARSRRLGPILAVAAGVALVAGAGTSWLLERSGRDPPPAERAPEAPPAGTAAIDPERPAPVAAATEGTSWRSAPVSRRWQPVRAEILSPVNGSVVWSREPGARVDAGERIGFVRAVAGAHGNGDARADAQIADLERLAREDPVYREFLEKARRDRRRRLERTSRRVALAAPATGRLSLAVPVGARRERGELLGSVVDSELWHLDARVAGTVPPLDAACEARGDDAGDRAPCAVVAASARGEWIEVTVALRAGLAPWVESATSPEVRLAPPGTAAGRPSPGGSP